MDTTQPHQQNSVEIRDLGLAAALVSVGHALQNTVRSDGGRVYFVFESTPTLQQDTSAYWSDTLLVGARTYSDSLKSLKSLIYGGRY